MKIIDPLPIPDTDAVIHSQKLIDFIQQKMIAAQGTLTFAEFMQHALYALNLGYYSAGLRKFGKGGDFVTAPEISPLFAQCLARQCQQILSQLESGVIVEFGAGSGKLAANLLQNLAQLACLPTQYIIIEISAELQQRQQTTLQAQLLPDLYHRIQWISTLPTTPLNAIVIANEVLDAMPIHRFRVSEQGIEEYCVSCENEQFVWQTHAVTAFDLQTAIENLQLPIHYQSEINLFLPAWINSVANFLNQGVVLLIDYGFPRHEYYHPQRNDGTLMCHYQHYAHSNPLILVGLQDITAHVDFTAVAEAAIAADLQVAGFTQQANFLLGCGLMELLSHYDAENVVEYARITQQIKTLTLPSEMGELFKVMALTRQFDIPLIGFMHDDRRRL